jgi:hypothetical protein
MQSSILVLTQPDSPNRFAGYIAEQLRVEGLNWFQVVDEAAFLDATSSSAGLESAGQGEPSPLIIATAAEFSDRTVERLVAHVRSGGSLLACRPANNMLTALGFPPSRPLPPEWSNRYVLLDPDSPIVRNLPWVESGVQFLGQPVALLQGREGDADTYVAPGPCAWIAPFPGQRTRFPALTAHLVGAGRSAFFAFDPAESAVRQQQGRPAQASTDTIVDFDGDGTFRPNDLFLGQLDPALRDVPQSDLQRTLLLRAIEWLTELAPLPRLWRFPAGAPAAAFFDGDSDAMDMQDFHNALYTCDRYDAPFATYLKPEHVELVSPEEEASARARGHRFGPHPWAGPQPSVDEMRDALEANCAAFGVRYGYRPRIHRGHWLVWPGWIEHARSLQEAGITLDANFTAGWGFKGGYVNGTGLPARFIDGDGRLLDVYEQSTISTDDGWLTPKGGLPAISLPDAISRSCGMIDAAVERYHTVYHPYFHPKPLKGGGAIPYPTRPWLDSVLAHAQRRGVPYLDAERWVDWNAARRVVQLAKVQSTSGDVRFTLHAQDAVEDITVLLPVPGAGSVAVSIDGAPVEGDNSASVVTRHGRAYATATLSLRAGEMREIRITAGL